MNHEITSESILKILDKVRCKDCVDTMIPLEKYSGQCPLIHITCPKCLWHGEYDEMGESVDCPKCDWGEAV